MRKITFEVANHFLFLGAHCDDIEIGCGGTIARLREDSPSARLSWVVFSGTEDRAAETRNAASRFGGIEVTVKRFRNGYFPTVVGELKDYIETLKSLQPDIIFTHFRHDLHQDHRVINELTWNTFRDHDILEYEIAKYDGDLGNPNLFVLLSKQQLEKKVEVLRSCFPSQTQKQWFDEQTFRGVSRIRGLQCASASGYAEAFYARKLVY